MKGYADMAWVWAVKNLSVINFVLISSFLLYTILKKNKIIEGFENDTIDFESLYNIGEIAKKLNAGGNFEFPGNLTVVGKLNVKEDITVNGSVLGKKQVDILNGTEAVALKVNKGSVVGEYLHNYTDGGVGVWHNATPENSNYTMHLPSSAVV